MHAAHTMRPPTRVPTVRLQETGALREDSLYIQRKADEELCRALLDGEVCAVLAPRQIGKSSLRVRTARILQHEGIHCAQVDLTTIGKTADRNAIAAWYFSLVVRIARELGLPDPKPFFEDLSALLPVDRFGRYLREQVVPVLDGPLVLFIDEIDYLRVLPIDRDEFFVAIRALYNERAHNPVLRRLTFCLLGVASPRDLVRNPDITPFNIGRSISLRDFSRVELGAFGSALLQLGGPVDPWLDEIFHWTAGHPYMTQVLSQQLLSQQDHRSELSLAARVQHAVQRRFLRSGRSSDDNLSYAERRLDQAEQKSELLALYHRILTEETVLSEDNNPVQQELQICGLVATDTSPDGVRVLRVRNRIFANVFNGEWLREKEAHRKLVHAVRRWQEHGRSDAALLRDADLAEAEHWVGEHAHQVTAEEHAFLRSCLGLARHEAERERLASDVRTQRRTLIGLVCFMVVLLLAMSGLYAQYLRIQKYAEGEQKAANEAQNQKQRAERERALAESAATTARLETARAEYAAEAEALARKEAQAALALAERARKSADLEAQRARRFAESERIAKLDAEAARKLAEQAAEDERVAAEAARSARMEAERQKEEAEKQRQESEQARVRAIEAQKIAELAVRTEGSLRAAALAEQPEHQVRALVEAMRVTLPIREGVLGPAWEGLNRATEANTLAVVLEGHAKAVRSAYFSPDGKRLVSASEDQTARVWDVTSGQLLFSLVGHTGMLRGAAFSPDGKYIVTVSDDTTARIWDADRGSLVSVLKGHSAWVLAARFSPDSARLVSTGFDSKVIVWDVWRARKQLVLDRVDGRALSAAFSPNQDHIVTSGLDGHASIFSARTGKLVRYLEMPRSNIRTADYSPDGRLLVTASTDAIARIWDAERGTFQRALIGHSAEVRSGVFSRDGALIATASEDRTVRLWDADSGKTIRTLAGHAGPVWSAQFSPDGQRIATASEDGTIRLWSLRAGQILRPLIGHNGDVRRAEFSPDGRHALTAGEDGFVRLWDARTGQLTTTIDAHAGEVSMASYSLAGDSIVTAAEDAMAQVWDVGSQSLKQQTELHPCWVRAARLSPSGSSVATVGDDGQVRIWNVTDSLQSGRMWAGIPPEQHPRRLNSLAFSPDGARLVTAGEDRLARIWDVQTGRLLSTLVGHGGIVFSVAYDASGRFILTASEDRTTRIWDAKSGLLKVSLSGHTDAVLSAEFSLDGRYVVTASRDRTARIWDAHTGRDLLTLRGHRAAVLSAAFAPDTQSVLTAGADGVAIVHPIKPTALYDFGCRFLRTLRNHPDAPEWELRSIFATCPRS